MPRSFSIFEMSLAEMRRRDCEPHLGELIHATPPEIEDPLTR
jgi:hypothetical protein